MKRRLLAFATACFLLLGLAACAQEEAQGGGAGGSTVREAVQSDELQFAPIPDGSPTAAIQTDKGTIHVVLYPQYAQLAVENFTTLAEEGYYNNTLFHRVVADFVIQAGDAGGTGEGGKSIWGHPFATERTDRLHHYSGALCMAADSGQPDTHLSQFYIVATPQDVLDDAALQKLRDAGLRDEVVDAYAKAGGTPYLDNLYTVFGQVYAGMDVVDAIAQSRADEDGRPAGDIRILSVTLDSYTAPPASAAPSAPPVSVPASDAPAPSGEPGSKPAPETEPSSTP